MATILPMPTSQPQLPRHFGLAKTVMEAVIKDMPNAGLDPAAIKKWQLVQAGQDSIVLATMDINIPNPQDFERATHRIQTVVRNRGITWAQAAFVNSTGWRWAIRISRAQPMPRLLPFPGMEKGQILVGMNREGRRVQFDLASWDSHAIVAGMTRSGKSSFVRLLIYQAIAGGAQVAIADMKAFTFQVFDGHLSLIRPIARTPKEADELIDALLGEIEHRMRLYQEMSGNPEKLSEYNREAIRAGKEPLPPVIVVLDEIQTAILALGGARGKFAEKVWDIARKGLALGVHVILTAQDMTKEALPMRDQFGMIICMRTQNPDTARNLNVSPAAKIPDKRPGLAYSSTSGWVQCYFHDKAEIARELPGATGGQTEEERKLFDAAQANRWIMPRGLIRDTLGIEDRAARKLQGDLALRGWLVKDPAQNNAFVVSDRWKAMAGPEGPISRAGRGWTGLDQVGPVGGWTESKPESGLEQP